MSFKPTPKQALILWKLLITQEIQKKYLLSPRLTPKELGELEQAGFIRIAERKQLREEGLTDEKGSGKHIMLADKAWDWAVDNFDAELYTSKYTKDVVAIITALLGLVDKNLELHEISLSDFLQPKPILNLESMSIKLEDLEEKICEAYSKVSGGSYNVRVRLSELRQHLKNLPRAEIDKVLSEMQRSGQLVLMPLDDPQEIRPEDETAAIDMGGPKRHILYMKG